jgi:outer membrane protein OmpA-like peptidoglycan-associated protein
VKGNTILKIIKMIFRFLLFIALIFPGISAAQDLQGSKVVQTSIFFGGGSWQIDDEQLAELEKLIQSINDIQDYQISIYSHTDNIGGREFNEWLSQKRSESVIGQLELLGIRSDYILKKDFGMSNPWFDNKKWEGKVLNRRVDVVISPFIF